MNTTHWNTCAAWCERHGLRPNQDDFQAYIEDLQADAR